MANRTAPHRALLYLAEPTDPPAPDPQADPPADPAADQALPTSRQLIVPIGTWEHPSYGKLEFTREMVDQLAANFAAGLRTMPGGRLPVTYNHETGDGAAGWITAVEPTDEGLYATIEWTQQGASDVKGRRFPYVSPELLDTFRDDAGYVHRNVLEGASIVVRPFLKALPAIEVLSDLEPVGLLQFGEPQLEAEQNEPLLLEVEALRKESRLRTFADDLRELRMPGGGGCYKLAPGCRKVFSELAADLPEEQADRLLQALRGMAMYPEGEWGIGGSPASSADPEAERVEKQITG